MSPNDKYSRAVPVRVNHLPEVVFDASGGRPADANAPRVVPGPTVIFPEQSFDMTPPPALALTFRLRTDASPAAVAVDLFAVWKVLNEYELRLRGSGLTPGEARDEQTADGTVIRLVLTPADPTGAADRLAKLVAVVNETADPAVPKDVFTGRSFDRCEAILSV